MLGSFWLVSVGLQMCMVTSLAAGYQSAGVAGPAVGERSIIETKAEQLNLRFEGAEKALVKFADGVAAYFHFNRATGELEGVQLFCLAAAPAEISEITGVRPKASPLLSDAEVDRYLRLIDALKTFGSACPSRPRVDGSDEVQWEATDYSAAEVSTRRFLRRHNEAPDAGNIADVNVQYWLTVPVVGTVVERRKIVQWAERSSGVVETIRYSMDAETSSRHYYEVDEGDFNRIRVGMRIRFQALGFGTRARSIQVLPTSPN